jgi:hypothetical protein
MAQHDYVIANGTGSAVRSDLNNALAAIVSQNSGTSEPSPTFAFQLWADTTTNTLKLRNSANSAWIELRQLDGDFTKVSVDNGTAGAPSIYFNASGTDTGFYSSGTDALDFSTAGTQRFGIGSTGDLTVFGGNVTLNAQGDLRFADSDSSNWVAFQSPATVSSNVTWTLPSADGTNGQALTTNGSGTLSWTSPTSTTDKITEGNTEAEVVDTGSDGHFKVTTEGTERLRVDSSGRVGIGTTSPQKRFVTSNGGAEGVEISPGDSSNKNVFLNYNRSSGAYITATHLADIHTWGGYGNTGSSEAMRIDASGRLLVGTSTARSSLGPDISPLQQVEGTSYTSSALSVINNQNTSNPSFLILGKSRGTSVGSNTVVQNGDAVGEIRFVAADGSSLQGRPGSISCEIDGTPGASDLPGRLVFSTTADGASSPTERMRIASDGTVVIGDTTTTTTSGTGQKFYNTTPSIPNFLTVSDDNIPAGRIIEHYNANASYNGVRFYVRLDGGIGNFQANNVNLSDVNSKKDITPAGGTWDCLKEWEIVNYRYNDQPNNSDLNMGVIAQQVVVSCPEVVTVFQEEKEATETEPAQEERLGVKEQQMMWMAIKALQEAQLRIEELEAKVAALEAS